MSNLLNKHRIVKHLKVEQQDLLNHPRLGHNTLLFQVMETYKQCQEHQGAEDLNEEISKMVMVYRKKNTVTARGEKDAESKVAVAGVPPLAAQGHLAEKGAESKVTALGTPPIKFGQSTGGKVSIELVKRDEQDNWSTDQGMSAPMKKAVAPELHPTTTSRPRPRPKLSEQHYNQCDKATNKDQAREREEREREK